MAQRRRIRKKKRVSPLRRAGKLAYRILVVLSAIIVVLYCAYRLASKKPTQAPEPTPEAPAGSLSPDQNEAPGRQRREGTYTFLLAASDQSSGNADTIIVASYDTEAQKVGMVSVPRDTLLESGKINAAYHKGPENLRDTVSNLLGVPIDYYVAVDVDGFVALVDELGGIEFDVPVRMSFDDPTQDLHIHYQPGLQHLTGEDVLKVARCRNNSDGPGSYPDNLYGAYPDGDIGRTRTQQQLIAAILKKALSNPQKINSYVNLFLEYVDTDLEFSEALWFAQPALGLDFSTGFASATLAGENVYYVDNNGTSRKPVYMKTADEDKPQKQTISVDGEDFAIEEVAENDLFLVTIAQGVIQTMDAPEVLSDTSISNFRLEKYVTAGGTQYDYADTVMYDEEVLDQYDDANMKDVTYNVILDAYGYMIGIEQNEDPDQYVFLTGIDGKNSNLSVRNADANVIFMDGNMDTVTVNMTKSDIDTTGKNLSQLNTWCTYTVNNDNVYTLKEVAVSTSKNVIDDDTDVAQYAQDVGSNGATIDKKHVSLKAANNSSYVYGNDDSVYLNVELKNVEVEDTTGGDQRQIVDDVESVTTGVKNVNLVMEDLKKDGNYIAPAAEIYTLYNDDGYVIAAVTIGENEGTSSNYVYVTSSNVNREAYDDETEWTWTREVVVNGELVEISEVGDSLEWIGNASKNQGEMAQGEWFEVKYDADGNVRKVEAIDFSKAADKFVDEVEDVEDAVEDFDTVLLSDTNTVEKLTFKNGTLYTDRNATKGFSVSPEVKVVLSLADKKGNEFDDVDDSYTGYNGLEKALRDMNAQGTFGTGVVEVSAILDNGVATSIVINDKAKAGSDVSNPTVPEGEFLPASWNPTTKGIELRYYEKSMSDSEIKAAIEDLLGAPVDRLNKFMGYVTLENGDMYRVNFTQIEVVAISIDGEVVSYPDKGDAANLTNIPAGNYFDINENPDGFIGGSNRGLLTVPSTGKVTVSNTNKDREFVTAYELDIDGTITSDVSAEVNGKTVSDGDYIADGEVVELTFTTAGDYTVNGELVRAAANDTYEIEATEAIMVRSVSNYMTEEDIADIVDAYNPGTPTGATITRSGDTLNIVLNNTVSDWTDVSGTGLFVLAEDLLEDNSILITFPDGSAERIDKGTNAAAAAAQLTPKLGNVSDLTPTPIVITVTVENAGSGASVEYTVNLSQAD